MRTATFFLPLMLSLGISFAAAGNAQSATTSTGSAQGSRGAAPVVQAGVQPQATPSQAAPTQNRGGQLGEHVSSHAPEHPIMHGVLFGECVSELATTGECSHPFDSH